MSDEPLRPDPDRLLQHTASAHRGKLKVFFGACAGVGKTWAMLAEAQRLRAQGLDRRTQALDASDEAQPPHRPGLSRQGHRHHASRPQP